MLGLMKKKEVVWVISKYKEPCNNNKQNPMCNTAM